MTSKFKKIDKKKTVLDVLFILAACALGAFGSIGILLPNGLSSGGITGTVRILQQFLNVDFSILYYGVSICVLIICGLTMGLREVRKIIIVSLTYPLFLILFEYLNFSLLEEKDLMLAAIFLGVIFGTSTGLALSRGYSFGATDTIAKIIKKKLLPHVSISKILLITDGVIIICSGVLFGRNIALYALITQVIMSRMIEFVIYGFETKVVQLEIITNKKEEITQYIMKDVDRGVSSAEVRGEYTKELRHKVITLCSPRESVVIRRFVADTDPSAFVTVIRVETVWGVGFADITEVDKEK